MTESKTTETQLMIKDLQTSFLGGGIAYELFQMQMGPAHFSDIDQLSSMWYLS